MKMKTMLKKFGCILLAAILCLSLAIPTFADDADFTIVDGVLTAYNGAGGDVVIPEGAISIGSYAFNGCSSLTSVTIPESVTSIGSNAFMDCSSLTSVTIPGSASIESSAFVRCTSLTSLTIPEGVGSIAFSAFSSCSGLKSLELPSTLGSIGNYAFSGCSSLEEITVARTTPPRVEGASFGAVSLPDVTLYVPAEAIETYQATAPWNTCKEILSVEQKPANTAPADAEFLSSVSFSKDYNDKYTTGSKTTAVNETVTYTIAPVSENAPAFANNTVTVSVEDGIGSGEIVMPENITAPGSYWYTLTENVGATAGVDYDGATYYLHLLTAYIDGAYGVTSAQIHTTEPAANGTWRDDDKVSTLSNTYGEGNLTVKQTVSGNGANNEDEFTVTVTFNAGDKTVVGNITYGEDGVISPEDWENGSTSVEITLHGDESITFSNIPDGVTYTVTQNEGYADLSYSAPTYTLADNEDPDTAGTENATGQITNLIDQVIINNEKSIPIDVGVILENGAFILLILGALAVGGYLVIARKRRSIIE